MPYRVGAKGSYGCSGYPAVKDTGEVMGCHKTRSEAAAQIYAINRSEGNIGKNMGEIKEGDFVMGETTEGMIHGMIEHIMTEGGTLGTPGSEYALVSMPPENPAMSVRIYEEEGGTWEPTAYSIGMMYKDAVKIDMYNHNMQETESEKSYHEKDKDKVKKEYEGCGCSTCKEMNVSCEDCPVCQEENMKSDCCENLNKKAPCWDGYVQRGMKPGKNGSMVPNCVPAKKADDLWEDDDSVFYETDTVSKAEGYSPPAGARAAARKAIKFKEQGKAKGAGTSVGWTRAGQLARGETLSLSTVKRMYSYFSRHEVDKKGKDWANQSNPSNGYIMWLAWGGDAGFAWSRRIVNAEKDKALFADTFNSIEKQSKKVRGSGNVVWEI